MASITFDLATVDASAQLGFEAWIDDQCFLDLEHVTQPQQVSVDLDDDLEAEHELRLVLKNKTGLHTQIDEHGNIVRDALLCVTNMAFDGIQLHYLFIKNAIYTHDFNGTQKITQDKCYGQLGCNGTVSLKFTTPMYMWILENM